MSSGVVERYKMKKKRDIVEYSKYLESIITLEINTLWDKKQEFNELCKGIVDYYVENYYFDNNINRDNPIEYSNDNINSVLLAIIEYYKIINQPNYVQEKKNESFLLAVIICTASYLDIGANIVDGSYSKVKSRFKDLLEHLYKTNLLKIYRNDRVTINALMEALKKNVAEEEKMFGYFRSDKCLNEYIEIMPSLYEVRFKYQVDGTEDLDPKMVKKIKESFVDKFLNISYELLGVLLLKENLMNKKASTYLLPISESMIRKDNSLKVLNDDLFKENIKILVDLEKYKNDNLTELKNQGFKIVYRYDGNDPTIFDDMYDKEVLIKEKFKGELVDIMSELTKRGVTVIAKSYICKRVTDDYICSKEEK